MDEYQYALMKQTLERIQELVFAWTENEVRGVDSSFDCMYEVQNALEEAGFHE